MFRKIILILFSISSIISSFSLNVPESIKQSVYKDFGKEVSIYSCEYDTKSNSYLLSLMKNKNIINVYYSEKGKLLKTIEYISVKYIPLKVVKKISELASKSEIGYYKKVTTPKSIYYKIFIFSEDGEFIYNISKEGKVLKKTMVLEEDDMGC